jgi:hypothetical protein
MVDVEPAEMVPVLLAGAGGAAVPEVPAWPPQPANPAVMSRQSSTDSALFMIIPPVFNFGANRPDAAMRMPPHPLFMRKPCQLPAFGPRNENFQHFCHFRKSGLSNFAFDFCRIGPAAGFNFIL